MCEQKILAVESLFVVFLLLYVAVQINKHLLALAQNFGARSTLVHTYILEATKLIYETAISGNWLVLSVAVTNYQKIVKRFFIRQTRTVEHFKTELEEEIPEKQEILLVCSARGEDKTSLGEMKEVVC